MIVRTHKLPSPWLTCKNVSIVDRPLGFYRFRDGCVLINLYCTVGRPQIACHVTVHRMHTCALYIALSASTIAVYSGDGPIYGVLRLFVLGRRPDALPVSNAGKESKEEDQSSVSYAAKLIVCVLALQAAYLTWGVLQVSGYTTR